MFAHCQKNWNFCPCGDQVENELKMVSDNTRPNMIFRALLFSLLLSSSSNWHNRLRNLSDLLPWLTTERPAAIFVCFFPNTRIFLAKAVYMVLGSSYLSVRKIIVRSNLALRIPAYYGHLVVTDSLLYPWGKPLKFSLNPTRLIRTTLMRATDTYFLPNQPILRESQPNVDTSLSTVCCDIFFPIWREKQTLVDSTSMFTGQDELSTSILLKLSGHQTSYAENSFD